MIYGELQVLSADKVRVDALNKKYTLYPVLFSKDEDWHIPIIEGRYFEIEDRDDGRSIILLVLQEESTEVLSGMI